MGKKEEKTNVMRILEQKKIDYVSHNYVETGAVSGLEVAAALGEDPDRAFKTLVTVGKDKGTLCVCGSGEQRAESEEGGTVCGREEYRDDQIQRTSSAYGICAWGMFSDRDEETVRDSH